MLNQEFRIVIEIMGIGLVSESFSFVARKGHILQIA